MNYLNDVKLELLSKDGSNEEDSASENWYLFLDIFVKATDKKAKFLSRL